MARQKPPDPPADDVPGWVMTFSDVITLLMTFFILLLTFATNQPETFERIQLAMFGGGGARGIAGETEGMEKDSLLMRKRALTGRMTQEGSEMPPIYSDPTLETLDAGIAGLEEDEDRTLATTHRIEVPLASMVVSNGPVTTSGQQRLRMIALQMRKMPLRLELLVGDEASLDEGIRVAEHMTQNERLPEPSVGVGVAPHLVGKDRLLMVLDLQESDRGP